MELKFLTKIWNGLTSETYSIIGKDNKIWLQFDAIDECRVHGSATTTKNPTESGFNQTDYKYFNPADISLKGVVSRNGIVGLGFLEQSYSLGGINKASLIENIRSQCDILTANMILLDIQTRNSGKRNNYTMVDYTIQETPENYNLLEVDMAFDQVLTYGSDGVVNRKASDTNTVSIGIVESLSQNLGKWWNS